MRKNRFLVSVIIGNPLDQVLGEIVAIDVLVGSRSYINAAVERFATAEEFKSIHSRLVVGTRDMVAVSSGFSLNGHN